MGKVEIPFTTTNGLNYTFDLSGLTLPQVNSLAIDCVVALAHTTRSTPRRVLETMIRTHDEAMR